MANNSKWSVTNETNKSVNAISSFDTSDSPSMEMIYQASLSYLETSGSDNQIAANSTTDVMLDTDNLIYDVVFSLPSNGFPVADTSASLPLTSTSDVYPPYSIASDALDAMENTYKFYQYIQAYPTSNTATNFISALKSQQNNGTQTQPPAENAIDTFFQGTKQFKNCTSVTYASVQSYIGTFAGTSVGFNPSYTFYMYQSTSDDVVANGQVIFNLNNLKVPFDLTDNNGGYSIFYTDSSGKNTSLTYNKGQFVSDVNADFPSICLVISWVSSNQINNGNNSPDSVIPMMSGTINGNQSCGTKDKKDLSTKSSTSFSTIFDYISNSVGLLMGVHFVYELTWGKRKARLAKERENQEKELTKEQNEEINNKLDSISEQIAKNNQDVADRAQSDIKFDSDLDSAGKNMQAAADELSFQQQRTVLQGQIDEYSNQLDKIAQYGVNDEIEDVAQKLRSASEELANASTLPEIKEVSSSLEITFNEIDSSLKSIVQNLGDDISSETIDEINASNENLNDLKEQQEAMNERQADEESGDSPEGPDFDMSVM
ncbi:apolipoprotein A1/A4/E family protein [Pectobacterium carotovorum]|nr:apolipoprotein A1/A4/E family protein [Pectobacterium carotovorum]